MAAKSAITDRNLALEAVRVTEAAARAASHHMGRGDDQAADQAAVKAMDLALTALSIDGTVRVGERDRGDNGGGILSVGAKVGKGQGPKMDVALMALEGSTIVAKGEPNAISVLAMAEDGGFLNVPDCYMDKIAVGGGLPADVVDLDAGPARNLKELAKAKGVEVGDLVACILDRPRHARLIADSRAAGVRVMLIGDGDVSGVMATAWPDSGVDIYMGIGGAPQGVLAAAALRCAGGCMQGRLYLHDAREKEDASNLGLTDPERKYGVEDMAKGNVTFAATGVTGGPMLRGVRSRHGVIVTQSMVMRSKTGTVRYVEAHHKFSGGG